MARAGLVVPIIVFSLIGCRPPASTLPPLPEMPDIQQHVALTTTSGEGACAGAEQLIEDESVLWMRIQLENERYQRLVLTTPGYQDAGTSVPSGGPGGYSTTNLQTAGVEEADVMKNDGTRMFTLSGNALVTLQTWPDTQLQVKGRADVGWGGARELLLSAPNEVMVFSSGFNGTHVTYVDVSDMANPRVTGTVDIPGTYLTARRVGAAVRVVVRHFFTFPSGVLIAPDLPPEDIAAWDAQAVANERLIREQPLSRWLPPVTTHDASGQEQSWPHPCDQVSSSNAPVEMGMTAVVTLNATGLTTVDRWSMLGHADTIYASTTHLYLASRHYWWWRRYWAGLRTATYVHQFDISTSATAVHVASGVFEGTIPNSFALDEWNGHLRVATSAFQPGGTFFQRTNRVLVLQPSGKEMVEVGRTPDFAGGETLESARFLGDRGFVVTFRRVDPLFTLDMSVPTAPRIVGELTVPGFSTYLHPVSDTQLVGVGTGTQAGAQVSLFDVSDLAQPTQTSVIQIPSGRSEAQWDHHAFTWLPERKLFAIPTDTWDETRSPAHQADLRVFQVAGADLLPQGALVIPDSPNGYAAVRRGILTTEDAYAIGDDRVTVARLADLSTPVATASLLPP